MLKLMEESIEIKLYLLQEKGPLSFTFQEENNSKKINISIGKKIECSCGVKNEHCVHSFYVLNRFFRLKFNDPLIIQIGYSDAELTKLIDIRNRKQEENKAKLMNKSKKNHIINNSNLIKKNRRIKSNESI